MIGDITIVDASITWNSGAATPQILLPPNTRLMVLALVFAGATGDQGNQVIVQSIQDTRTSLQRILGTTSGNNGIPARMFCHCGGFNPQTGPRWFGTRASLLDRLSKEAELANVELNRLTAPVSRLFGTTELPPVAGFVVNTDYLNLTLKARNGDEPASVSAVCLEMAPSDSLDMDLLASPFWFSPAIKSFGTAADGALNWADQIQTPARLLKGRQAFRHRATMLTMLNASSGALISDETYLVNLRGQKPAAGGDYFASGDVAAASFAANPTGAFDVPYCNGDIVTWTGSKGATFAAADAYLSHQFSIS